MSKSKIESTTYVVETLVLDADVPNVLSFKKNEVTTKQLKVKLQGLALYGRNPSFAQDLDRISVDYGCRNITPDLLDSIIEEIRGKSPIVRVISRTTLAKKNFGKPLLNNDAILLDESDKYFISKALKAYHKDNYCIIEKRKQILTVVNGNITFEGYGIFKDTETNWIKLEKVATQLKEIFDFLKAKPASK